MKAFLQMLDEGEVARIHEATLKVLETTGVSIMSDEVVEHLVRCGAKAVGDRVRFPREMVRDSLDMLDHEIEYAGVDDRFSFTFPDGMTTHNSTSGYGPFYYPEPGAKRRLSTAEDLVKMASLANELDDVDFFWPITMPTEEKCNPIQELQAFNVSARHTGKHIECSCSSPEAARWQVRLAEALAGGSKELWDKPIVSVVASPTTPLGFEKDTVEAFPIMAKAGIPINPMDVPIAASTSPATYAGTLVVTNAEQLAVLVIAKSYEERARVVYSCDVCAANMATGNLSYVNPDYDLFSIACGDIAHHYGYPCCVGHGSNEVKNLTTVESLMNNVQKIAFNQMTRTDLACWIGSMDDSIATSIWDIMLDIEALRYAKIYCKQLKIDDDTLALDVIDEVGPHGEYMSCEHTLEHYRDELGTLSPEDSYLFADGGQDYIEKANEKGLELLAATTPYTLDEDVSDELEGIMTAAYKELR